MRKNKHHRKPRFVGGRNNKRNISFVCKEKHHCWHVLFGIKTAHEIADEINKHWIDPDFKFIVKPS